MKPTVMAALLEMLDYFFPEVSITFPLLQNISINIFLFLNRLYSTETFSGLKEYKRYEHYVFL